MYSRACKKGTLFFFNGDFSGNIHINIGNVKVQVPAADVLELVSMEYVLPKMIQKVESLDDSELLEHLIENLG